MGLAPKWLGRFVTAKVADAVASCQGECMQGWVVELDPFIIKGQSGRYYHCEGEPVLVDNPPSNTT